MRCIDKSTKMKIGIITDYLDFQVTGIGNYINNLVMGILAVDKKNEYTLIHIKKQDRPHYSNVKDIVVPLPMFPPRAIIRKNVLIPKVLKNEGLDLVHEPLQITPFLFQLPMKRVITIHDVNCIIRPMDYSIWEQWYYSWVLKNTVKTADMIITISENSKRDIVKALNVPEDKIRVIYHGLDKNFKPITDLDDISLKYGINYPFILYVGRLEPRKNIPTLIKSFYRLKKRGVKHKLLMVIQMGSDYQKVVASIKDLCLENEVRLIEGVPKEDMAGVYNLADLLVFPSVYEGFGFPPLEAMGCGTPVVTSNSSSLPEIIGDAGIMVDPYDSDALTNAIYEVLVNKELKDDLIRKGLKRTKQFSWEKATKETIEVYEKVAGS